ncbi:MAG: SUF system NifU family Fe-S cluster assembly protein [Pseudomonadota bacterium]|nr:SUF system NifU family Fe-S cluster assembly protein [Pseudomonadota bacterium]
MDELLQLYQQMIIDHGQHPRNFGEIDNPTFREKGHNPFCGDQLEMFIVVDDDNIITDIKFNGHGCAISMASASMLTEMVIGKKLDYIKGLVDDFNAMLVTQDISDEAKERLGKIAILEGVKQYPSRIKCATLSWHALLNACEGKGTASTE